MKDSPRYFTSIGRIGDFTKMVIAQKGKKISLLVLIDGSLRETSCYSIDECERHVQSKLWREITKEEAVLM